MLKDSVFALQKMVLRHEDFGNCLKSELAWAMFLRLDMKATILPCLYQSTERWRTLKENNPEQLKAPMRVDLVKAVFRELGCRLGMILQNEAQLQTVTKLGWFTKEPMCWHYVKWDSAHERLRPDSEREPLPHENVAAIIGSIQQLADTPGVVTRFHPSREIMEHMGGKNLTMSLQTGIMGDAAQSMRIHLHALSDLSATQLIGMGIRQERPGRSALANVIQRHIHASK